jgi:hypothetical protein
MQEFDVRSIIIKIVRIQEINQRNPNQTKVSIIEERNLTNR